MVVTELAPFWLVVHARGARSGSCSGVDQLGRFARRWLMLVVIALLLCIVTARSRVAARWRLAAGRRRRAAGASEQRRLAGVPVSTPTGVSEEHGIELADGLTLDLVRPDDDRRTPPVLVYVHGGGWTGGDPQRQARDLYHALALDGVGGPWRSGTRSPPTPRSSDQIATRASMRYGGRGAGFRGTESRPTAVVLGGRVGRRSPRDDGGAHARDRRRAGRRVRRHLRRSTTWRTGTSARARGP